VLYKQHVDYCFSKNLKGSGIPSEVFESMLPFAETVINSLKHSSSERSLPLFSMLRDENDLIYIEEISKIICNSFEKLVVIAVGGASLNPGIFVNYAKRNKQKMQISVIDNIDPSDFELSLSEIDYSKTGFLVISKSGSNIGTLAASLTIINKIYKNFGRSYDFSKHFFFITSKNKSPLHDLALELKSHIIEHVNLAGRFATLTSSGLLMAAVNGFSVREIRAGSLFAVEEKLPEIASGAALTTGLLAYSYNINCLMTFQNAFSGFSKWYQRMSSETLGKDKKGITPIIASTNSQQQGLLQLFLEGPSDKFFTLISHNTEGDGHKINCGNKYPHLDGKTLGTINQQMQKNTIASLIKKGLPTRIMKIYDLDSYTIGALIMHFTLEAIVTAKLLKVNPFTQNSTLEASMELRKMMSETA